MPHQFGQGAGQVVVGVHRLGNEEDFADRFGVVSAFGQDFGDRAGRGDAEEGAVGVGTGARPLEIAGRLFLSHGTVRNYLGFAVAKLDARNRVDAVRRIAEEASWL
ncbi:transcriptional regulator, LuxR family [Catenulispora acidiphila DSM 44928]|uniref:Transcriptional regulator, LuxR family n=1 Tax=Catenulispora acidiphila (strain DSM 44928 / JCM 14897 / NBRC 102108 / NRRL B-24433 / ID139908) TaxID=479433 RepID=C7QER0_CATAD|nr:helix-turn-helix transcriptional regulator [Catenulispora acidiphila]ACU72830.1 transcriptional regulator, LuxR family [Catenulispora acidiphila DSM 44928]